MLRLCILASSAAIVTLSLGVAPAFAANANTPACDKSSITLGATPFTVNGGAPTADLNNLKQGDHVVVTFTIAANCTNVEVTFASYFGSAASQADILKETQFSHDTRLFNSGTHTLAIDIPCQYQADFAFGPWIEKFALDNFYGDRLISTGAGISPCTTPTPTPTESIQASSTPTPTESISATSSPSASSSAGHGSVLGASVTNPNTGNGSEAFAGFVALLMVLTGIAILAEVRRRRISS